VSDLARRELGWQPRYDFTRALERLDAGDDYRSEFARAIGSKGYHAERFGDGPYLSESPTQLQAVARASRWAICALG
jgi:hypothetical protein